MSFARAITHLLRMEGGYVPNLGDGAGATNFGISQRAYPNIDVKNLLQSEAVAIYSKDYWEPIQGDLLPDAVAFALLDFAVNSGVLAAVKALQRAVDVSVDGVMGPQTIAACNKPGVITALSVQRILLLTSLPGWPTFGHSWASRVIDTAIEAFP